MVALNSRGLTAIETVQKGGVPLGIVPKEKEHETITLDAFRRIVSKSELAEVMCQA
jgi:hypothetical protein